MCQLRAASASASTRVLLRSPWPHEGLRRWSHERDGVSPVATIHGKVSAIDGNHAAVPHEFRHPHNAGIRQIHLPIGVLPQQLISFAATPPWQGACVSPVPLPEHSRRPNVDPFSVNVKRRELERAIRAATRASCESEFLLIGSQAVHAATRRIPRGLA